MRLYLRDSPSRTAFFLRKSSRSMTMGLPTRLAYPTTLATASPMSASALVTGLPVGHQRHTEGVDVVARGVSLGNG